MVVYIRIICSEFSKMIIYFLVKFWNKKKKLFFIKNERNLGYELSRERIIILFEGVEEECVWGGEGVRKKMIYFNFWVEKI